MPDLIPYKRISLEERKDRGESFTVKQRFAERIKAAGLGGVQARIEGASEETVLYVSPAYLTNQGIEQLIQHTLEGLQRDLRGTKVTVSELLLPESLEEARHSAEMACSDALAARTEREILGREQELLQVQTRTAQLELEGKLEDLEAQLATAQSTYQELQRTYQELETQHTALSQEQHPKKRRRKPEQQLQPQPTTIQELTEALAYNFRLHQEQQEQLIAPFLYRARDTIQRYTPYEKQPEVDAAILVLEGKKQFEALATQTGKTLEDILKNLPNEIRATTLSSWEEAEQRVQAYQAALEHRELILPVRIAKHDRSTTLIFPIDPESRQGMHPQLHQSLQGYHRNIQPKHTMAAWLRSENGLSTITIQGQPSNEDLKEEIRATFQLKDTKITPYFIETRYFLGLPPREEAQQEQKEKKGEFSTFVLEQINKLGYQNIKDFVAGSNCALSRNTVYNLIKGGGARTKKPTLDKLAVALQISVEELEKRQRI